MMIKSYLQRLKRQCILGWFSSSNFTKKTPDDLIEESIDDHEIAGQRLDDFYRYKKELIDRNSCITGIYGTLRGFYRHNKVMVQDISSPRFSPRQVKKTDANYPLFIRVETEQNGKKIKKSVLNRPLIREFASHLNYRDQTIHLCVMSSGLDSNDVLKLTIGDILRQADHSRIYMNDVRNKNFMEYKDFFSTEATERIRTYIKRERKDAAETEPVFVTSIKSRKARFKKETGRSHRLGDSLPKANRLSASDLSDAFRDAQIAMGITLEKGKQSPLRPKRWRKVFKTAASNAHVDRDIIKIMLGHDGEYGNVHTEILNEDSVVKAEFEYAKSYSGSTWSNWSGTGGSNDTPLCYDKVSHTYFKMGYDNSSGCDYT